MGIKSFKLEPSEENIISTLKQDLLGRNDSVWSLCNFINEQDDGCVISIDARWGDGKTFFVKQVEMVLNCYNPNVSSISDVDKKDIVSIFDNIAKTNKRENDFEPYVCVYYDAWLNDNSSDPIMSLVYEIIKSTASLYEIKKSPDYLKSAELIIDTITGKKLSGLSESLKSKDYLNEIKEEKTIHEMVNDFLESLLPEHGNRLLIIVDELDRCKPNFAIQVLERIKHYFNNSKITFLISVNTTELQHTIKKHYGNEFDGVRYLDRFFDYKMMLPKADMNKYYNAIGLNNGSYVFESVCRAFIDEYNMSIREIEKYYRIAKAAAYSPTHDNRYQYSFPEGHGIEFGYVLVVPIIIGLQIINPDLYQSFINGVDCDPMIKILNQDEFGNGYLCQIKNDNETYNQSDNTDLKYIDLKQRLTDVYNAIFNDKKNNSFEGKEFGKCSFNRNTKDKILETSNLILSKFR